MKQSIAALLFFVGITFCNSLSAAPITGVDQLLLKAFAATYPAAEKILWTEKNGNFTVQFVERNVRSVIEYDANARVVLSLRYFSDPAMLPQNIRLEWHRRFADKALYGITEVSDGQTTAWFLKGQDAKQWITVKAGQDNSMDVVESFRKQL